MKKAIFSVICLFCAYMTLSAQSYPIETMLKKYSGHKDVEIVEISSQFLSLYLEKERNDLLEKIEKLVIVNFYDKSTTGFVKKSLSEIRSAVTGDSFSKIISLNDVTSNTEIYTKNRDILIFMIEEKKEGSVIYIRGTIDDRLMKAVMDGEISIKSK